jgi:hypothetical protein
MQSRFCTDAMSESFRYALEYYAHQGLVSDPGEYVGLFDDLPSEIPALSQIVQGVLLHIFWAERYGSDEAFSEVRTLYENDARLRRPKDWLSEPSE